MVNLSEVAEQEGQLVPKMVAGGNLRGQLGGGLPEAEEARQLRRGAHRFSPPKPPQVGNGGEVSLGSRPQAGP